MGPKVAQKGSKSGPKVVILGSYLDRFWTGSGQDPDPLLSGKTRIYGYTPLWGVPDPLKRGSGSEPDLTPKVVILEHI